MGIKEQVESCLGHDMVRLRHQIAITKSRSVGVRGRVWRATRLALSTRYIASPNLASWRDVSHHKLVVPPAPCVAWDLAGPLRRIDAFPMS